MATIVEYTDQRPACNRHPDRIVSPLRASPCCFIAMETIGEPQQDGHWLFCYRRCRHCGFTVRSILRAMPDPTLERLLKRSFATLFRRERLEDLGNHTSRRPRRLAGLARESAP